MISFKNVSFCYPSYGQEPKKALTDVSFTIPDGTFVGIAGNMGSGKTTLCSLMSGLLKPTSGQIEKTGSVSFAMQFPENQLFEGTVIKDVMFGPLNRGLSEKEARMISEKCLASLGLGESFFDRNPLRLSGGEKRRVALAGILSMDADTIILDEPCAGLDPKWHDRLYEILQDLNRKGKTVIIVSHNTDDIARYCRTMLYLKSSELADIGNVGDVICRHEELETSSMAFARRLSEAGMEIDYKKAVTTEGLASLIADRQSSL